MRLTRCCKATWDDRTLLTTPDGHTVDNMPSHSSVKMH